MTALAAEQTQLSVPVYEATQTRRVHFGDAHGTARGIPRVAVLGGPEFLPGRTVQAELSVDGADTIVACEKVWGIFGVGSSAALAIDDLRAALVDFRDSLEDDEDTLAPGLRDQLAYLRGLLAPR